MRDIPGHEITPAEFSEAIAAGPLTFMADLAAEYPRIVEMKPEREPRLLIAFDPKLIAAVLANGTRTHRGLLRDLVGTGLFVAASGEPWQARRRLLRPFFHRDAVESWRAVVRDVVRTFLAKEVPAGEVNLAQLMQDLSVRIILTLVDRDLRGDELDELAAALGFVVHYLDLALFDPCQVTDSLTGQFELRREELYAHIGTRSAQEPDGGLLSGLNAVLDDAPDRRTVLREEIISIFVAGVETMGALFTWMFVYLQSAPSAGAHLLADPDDDAFHLAVVQETLRLAPPAWALRRELSRDLTVDGWELRSRDVVLVSPFVTQRSARHWTDPDSFRPQRWLERPQPQSYTWFPFGGGPHLCLGHQLTLMEAQIVLREVTEHFQVVIGAPPPGQTAKPGIALALKPDPRAVLTARR